jgi:glycerol-3-phosphate acyltransferase PlsY
MLAVALCLAYALGCLSPGWWLVRRSTGADLRVEGSGGTGATNAARVLGGRAFVIVLLLDAAKAAAAVLIARALVPTNPWHSLALPLAVAGHIWPVTLRFSGGRGAGPLLGGCVALNPLFAVAAAVPAALVAIFVRRTFALTSAAAAGGIACAWWLLPSVEDRTAFAAAVSLVLLAHRTHFARIFRSVP